jgi:hypothetical protein
MPRASTPDAGPLAFEVSATPAGDTTAAVVTPGVVDVRPFSHLSASLSDNHDEVTLGNRGNAPVTASLTVERDEGVEASVAPATVVVPKEGKATAALTVNAKRPLVGKGRSYGFRVVAEPDVGERVQVGATIRRRPLLSPGAATGGAIVVAVVLVAGLVVATHGSGSGAPSTTVAAAGAVKLDACPAKGHVDAYGVRSIQPNEIAQLPKTYTFLKVAGDGCTPDRFNPCEPIHYVQNAAAAPPFAADNVREAFRRLAAATGMKFVDDGLTDEDARTGPYVPERYGQRWAPILIDWQHFPPEQTNGASQVLGNTNIMRIGDTTVSGRLRFNVDAYNNEITKAPIEAGFGPSAGSGTGPIGRDNIQWGRVVLHELAHVVGLGHSSDPASLMYPDAAQQTSRPADFNRTDLAGLQYLGKDAGCLPEPPLPTS